jgi:hypothetical protein
MMDLTAGTIPTHMNGGTALETTGESTTMDTGAMNIPTTTNTTGSNGPPLTPMSTFTQTALNTGGMHLLKSGITTHKEYGTTTTGVMDTLHWDTDLQSISE